MKADGCISCRHWADIFACSFQISSASKSLSKSPSDAWMHYTNHSRQLQAGGLDHTVGNIRCGIFKNSFINRCLFNTV